MNKDLPIYIATINPEEEGDNGFNYVALVDKPAIEQNWMAFDAQKPYKFEVSSVEKQVISGPLMVANLPIYRRDEQMGEYFIMFPPEQIEKGVQKFFKKKNSGNVNLMHDMGRVVDGVYMFESFIIDKDRGIMPPKGFESLPDGSWFGSFKVDNKELWDEFLKSGELKGFSLEGMFGIEPMSEQPKDAFDEILEVIKSM